ncbi:MAG: PKD domain-containing protein, partial [Bacteroidales bacterium]|nr:PKD domain-containing protein [Bacteroidales bacterium]
VFSPMGPGIYDVRIKDAGVDNCEVILNSSLRITEPAELSATVQSTNITCNGANNGTITVSLPTGGYGTYDYSIDGGSTWQMTGLFTGLRPDTYNVQIRDRAHPLCVKVLNNALVISEPGLLTATVTSANITCYGANNGTITISSPAGGYGRYEYSVDGGVTWQSSGLFTGLVPGSYNVMIRDADYIQCRQVLVPSLLIEEPEALSASLSSTNITCFNSADGTITISSPSGGSGSYEYTIDGGTSWHPDGNFTSLTPGFYNVQMRDQLNPGCIRVLNSSLRITEPAILNATVSKFDITCFGGNNGRILLTLPSGGSGNYEYRINLTSAWQTSGDFTGLGPGEYVVQIRDAVNTGCIRTLNPNLTINEPAQLSATVEFTNITCYGANNGTISITNPAGGYGTYQYSIDGTQWFSSGYFTSLSASTYNVRIRDAANPACFAVLTELDIEEPEELNATVESTNITCFGRGDGTITISDPEGGYGRYEFTINGGGSWQSDGTYTGLGPGNYNVQMRDADQPGCIRILNNSLRITQPEMLRATVIKTDVSCSGNNDGTITISSPSGGSGNYQYSIDGGQSWQDSGDYTGRIPGTYDVRIRDAMNMNCYVILNPGLMITEPLVLTMSTSGDVTLDCNGDHDGTGTFYAYGGTMPYYFEVVSNSTGGLVPPAVFNSLLFYNAGAGSITVRVTDNNGCTAEATINISQPDALTPGTIGQDQQICYGGTPSPINELTPASGGPGSYRYQWQYSADPGGPFMNIPYANEKDYTPPASASYTFYYRRMVTSGVCLPDYSNVVEVKVNPLPIAVLSGGEIICPGESAFLRVNMLSGAGPFTVEIEGHGIVTGYNSGDPIEVRPASTTTYRLVRVTDSNNCTVVAPSASLNGSATITVSQLPVIRSITPSQSVCEYTMVRISVITDGTNLEYRWYVDDGSGPVAISDGGTYYGSITPDLTILSTTRELNGNRYYAVVSGCGVSVTSEISELTVNTPAEITLAPSDITICTGQNAVFEADASGSSLSWQWYVNMGSGFVPATDNSYISGSRTRILTVTNAQSSFNNWVFRAVATGICGAPAGTNLAILKVISPPAVTVNPVSVPVCENGSVTFNANGTGYQSMRWQVLQAGNWTDLSDDQTYIGTNTQLLAIMNASLAMNGNQYRLALIGACATTWSNPATLTVNANPVVDFSAISPINACGGVPVVLDGNPSGGSGTYNQHRWTGDIGPLSSYIVQSPTFNSVIPGEFNLNYRVTDSNGCSGNGDVKVIVDSPSAQFTQDVTFGCTPLQVTFSKDMSGYTSWEWNFGDGSPVDQVSQNPVHTFVSTQPGSIEFFEVRLRVETAGGCTDEYSSFVTIYPAVDASFTPDAAVICSGDIVTFTASPGAGRYFWDYGDNVRGYGMHSVTHLYTNYTTEPLEVTVSLTTTSFFNCTDTKTYNITVMPVPVPQFTADPVLQVFTPPGSQVTFTNQTNTGNWTWLWKFGDNTTSTEMNPVHTYRDVGTYYITLIAGNQYCSDSIMHYVNLVPPAPVANFDSIPSGCAPLAVTFNNTSLNTDVPGTEYRWYFGDGSTSTAKSPTYTYVTPGDYKVELIVTGPGGTSRKNQMVHAYPSPRAYFEVAPSFVYVNDESVRCFNLSTGADSYLWEFGDGDTSTLKEPYHKYMLEGVYDITLWAYSNNGCSDMYKLSPAVTVEPLGELRFPSVFTPNKDGPIERTDLPTGGVEVDQFFYPPIRQRVLEYKLQIFNRWGVLIFESDNINVPWNGYYNNELCPQGVYVWYVEGKFADGKPFKMVGNVTLLH